MNVRITVLDENLVKKLRIEQARLIGKQKKAISFSQVLGNVAKKGMQREKD